MIINSIFIIVTFIPLIFAMAVSVSISNIKLRDILIFLTSLCNLWVAQRLSVKLFLEGQILHYDLGTLYENITISFITSYHGMIFYNLIAILYPIAILYTIGYVRINNVSHQPTFYFFFNLAVLAAFALALSENIFTMFIFYELITASTYPLVVSKRNQVSRSAGRIYLSFLIATSSLLFLPAIIILFNHTGSVSFQAGGIFNETFISQEKLNLLVFMFLFGIGKTAVMPVHIWLPSAMIAPTPVSALLHAVVVVKSGLFTLISVIYFIFGTDLLNEHLYRIGQNNWITYVAVFTIITASTIALFQNKIKKLLAYSTVSQLSYVILSLSMLNMIGFRAAMMQMVAHAFAKITLFFGAGAIQTCTEEDKISRMKGLVRFMPITVASMTIGALSIIGLPPVIGFRSKYLILTGAVNSQNLLITLTIAISTLLSVAYFYTFIHSVVFAKVGYISNYDFEYKSIKPRIYLMYLLVPIMTSAAITMLLFFLPINMNKLLLD